MSKHRHQSKEEQINNRAHNTAPFQQSKRTDQKDEMIRPENVQIKAAIEQSSIQERAYQIHSEKGGSPLDNWLEAEQLLNNNGADLFRSVKEDGPVRFQKRNGKPSREDIYK